MARAKRQYPGNYMTVGFNYYRKLWHMAGLSLPVILYLDLFAFLGSYFSDPSRAVLILFSVTSIPILFLLDLKRFRSPAFADLAERVLGRVMKQEERVRFNAIIPYMMANTLLLFFMGRDVVIVSMILLSVGDPAAAIFGEYFGKHRFRNGKSLEGLFGFILVGMLCCLLFLYINGLAPAADRLILLTHGKLQSGPLGAVTAAILAGAIAEFFSDSACKGLVDDNLLVPLSAALALITTGYLFFHQPLEVLLSNLLQIS